MVADLIIYQVREGRVTRHKPTILGITALIAWIAAAGSTIAIPDLIRAYARQHSVVLAAAVTLTIMWMWLKHTHEPNPHAERERDAYGEVMWQFGRASSAAPRRHRGAVATCLAMSLALAAGTYLVVRGAPPPTPPVAQGPTPEAQQREDGRQDIIGGESPRAGPRPRRTESADPATPRPERMVVGDEAHPAAEPAEADEAETSAAGTSEREKATAGARDERGGGKDPCVINADLLRLRVGRLAC